MLELYYRQPPNDYPTSDGKPMAETDAHRDQMVELIQTLQYHFRRNFDVYVSGNILWFYQQGNRRRHVSPDTLVRFGALKGNRLNYLQWEEGGPPEVVFELTSKTTRKDDLGRKFSLYEQLKVEEYYLFDPLGEYLKPRFRAFHLLNGQYKEVSEATVYSPRLDLEVFVLSDKLRLRCLRSGLVLTTSDERAALESAKAEREALKARRAAEKAERESQRAERESHRAERESQRAERESQRAERATERAELEAQRAQAAEEELRILRAQLKAQGA